ncbi:MAG: aminomethyltransferase beta-barrel domain-containing protein, partial [Burkholderiaceae bacterium]
LDGASRAAATVDAGLHQPWYVARKDLQRNTLWVVPGHDHRWLQYRSLRADDASWVSGVAPGAGALTAKSRYRQADADAVLSAGPSDASFLLDFAQAQWAVTPGQSAVLYAGEVCLGGGVIHSATEAV